MRYVDIFGKRHIENWAKYSTFQFLSQQGTNWQTHKPKYEILFRFIFELGLGEYVHQVWLKTIENWGKQSIFLFLNEQMNQLTDTQTKKFNFILADLWDRSRRWCLPILVNISSKLSKLSHFSIFQQTNEPTHRHKQKFQYSF